MADSKNLREYEERPRRNQIHNCGDQLQLDTQKPAEFHPRPNKISKSSAAIFSDRVNTVSKRASMDMRPREQERKGKAIDARSNSNWIYRSRSPPQAEFDSRPNKISKSSAGDFSDGVNTVGKRAPMDMRPREQERKGKAIDARSNLSTSFEKPLRPNSRQIGRSIGQPPRPELESRTNNIYKSNSDWMYRSRTPPQAEFHPRRYKISKSSAGDFSDGVNTVSKRASMDVRPREQERKGKAIDTRSNHSKSFEHPVRPKSRQVGRAIGQPSQPELEPRTNNIYKTNSNWIYRSRPSPQPEFHPRPNKISKSSAADFSAGVNTVSERAQERKGKAIDSRSNLSTSFEQPERPKSRQIGRSIGQPPRPEIEFRTNNIYKASTSSPAPRLPPPPPVNVNQPDNWRLACFMANEYLTHGTLLGRPWPPPDSNTEHQENNNESKPASATEE